MKIRVANRWVKAHPGWRVGNQWTRSGQRFIKVQDQWRDVSEPTKPASIIDLLIIPTHQFLNYGERFGFAHSYNPPGQISTNVLNLHNPAISFASCEWGFTGHPTIPAWHWFTFHLGGDQRGVPWPELGWFNDIPLHFVSNDWQPQYGATRVWYRSYRELPRNQNQHRILI